MGPPANRQEAEMMEWKHTDQAQNFVNTADSRETSREIMQAIADFASSLEEAEEIWENGISDWDDLAKRNFVATVTGEGRRGEPSDFCWGVQGLRWALTL